MMQHALTIIVNELNRHLQAAYGSVPPQVALGNMAEIAAKPAETNATERKKVYLSVVNIKEEKTLKNLPNYRINHASNRVVYENQPVFLNFVILLSAPHPEYTDALMVLSRVIRFFQSRNVFTQDDVAPDSLTDSMPTNILDQLETFKLIFDLYSPSMEEINHMWGTLGGKQYPFVLYNLRMLEMQFKSSLGEAETIQEIGKGYHVTDSTGT